MKGTFMLGVFSQDLNILNQVYSPIGFGLMIVIPSLIIMGLRFNLIIVHGMLKPTVNLFRKWRNQPPIK